MFYDKILNEPNIVGMATESWEKKITIPWKLITLKEIQISNNRFI